MVLALLVAVVGMAALAGPAAAATVYEIEGEWEANTPGTVGRGDVVTGVWRVNVNDDQPAPSNDPVDNVTFTVTATNGLFKTLPDLCLTSGVDPASSISADGKTLTCNLGTVVQGTAVVVQAPMVVDGKTGDQISAIGEIAGLTDDLPPLDIVNDFVMDIHYGQNTGIYKWNNTTTGLDIDVQWSLRLGKGSDPGPDTVTYRLNVGALGATDVSVGTHPRGAVGCSPFDFYIANGHPWSELPGYPADRQTSFVDSCTLTEVSPGVFDLTLTGINYDLLSVPSKDSADQPLPTDWDYIASGSLWFHVTTTQQGSLTLTSNAPTYTAPTGQQFTDPAGNNSTNKAYTLPGAFSGGWDRPWSGAGGTVWDDTFRVSAGTTVRQGTTNGFYADNAPASAPYGNCFAFDTKYVTYVPNSIEPWATSLEGPGHHFTPATAEYYVGGNALVDPNSPSYNPSQFNCGVTDGGWTTTQPADPSLVKAVRITYPHSTFAAEDAEYLQLYVQTKIHDNVAIGQDIWTFASALRNGTWIGPEFDNSVITLTPGARYPHTNGRRDILRIIYATPAIQKASDRQVVKPGEPVSYTLTYSANGAGATPPTVDDYTITDTLPVGLTYVPGSATPAPTVTTDLQGRQVLTWELDDVPTNAPNTLTYQAVAGDSVTPGQTLTNTAVSSLAGEDSRPASAQVTVSSSGYTEISKTADTPFIPNLTGDGVGEGVWTVRVRSFDPLPQAFTDTIDILPWEGDARGTDYEGSYSLVAIEPLDGQTVYYTDADPSGLSDDPNAAANGAANAPSALWSTTRPANPTAVRVIGPALAPGAVQSFRVRIATDGADGADVYVNRAQARTGHTRLVMRTSEPMTVAQYYAANLKKYVQDVNGKWHDAQDVTDYPTFRYGETVRYRIVVTNVGQGTITNLDVSDDQQPALGNFHVDSLAPGESQSHEFEFVLDESTDGTVVNTACGQADIPADSQVPPTINCDPAGFEVANYKTVKSADPRPGAKVYPGQKVTYTVTVTQQGSAPAEAEFSDNLAKVLDDARYNKDVRASIGTASYRRGHIVWSGTIPVDGVAKITYSVTVKSITNLRKDGSFGLKNVVSSPGCVPDTTSAASSARQTVGCKTVHEIGKFDLALDKTLLSGTRAKGSTLTYRLRVSSKGPDTAPAPITLIDRLPNGLELQSAQGTGWDCKVAKASDTVQCVRDRSLKAGRTAPSVIVVAKVANPRRGVVNTARVTRDGDTKRSNNTDTATPPPPPPSTGFRFRQREWL